MQDIEKLATKKGVISQSVKEVLQVHLIHVRQQGYAIMWLIDV